MATNTDTPQGAKPFGKVLRTGYYKKDSSAAAIGQGSPVKQDSDGCVVLGTAGATLLGFAAKYSAASTEDTAFPVYDHPDQEFVIQEDSDGTTLAETNQFNNFDLTTDTVSTTTGMSSCEIDSSSNSVDPTATAQVRLLRAAPTIYPDGVENAIGANCDWIIQINEHALKTTTGT